jgi:hypothetical protein
LSAGRDTPHIPGMSHADPPAPSPASDRRHNARLRELVDEMLASIRAAANVDLWSPQERSRYEADLARIMDTVRRQALARAAPPRAALSRPAAGRPRPVPPPPARRPAAAPSR